MVVGAVIFGKNFEKSTLKISKILIIPRIPKAIGESIPITFVRDTCRIVVKIRPNRNINEITPRTTSRPRKISVFLLISSLLEN